MATKAEKFLPQYKSLPDKPGVYLMKNVRGRIIYIGKAKSLKKRVQSYFTGSKDLKTLILMKNVEDIETIITRSDYEALLLENNLIKQWKPRFNINLKDGKSYPVIRITAEEYPRVFRTRRIIFDGSQYFGPYPHASQLDLYLGLIEKLFPLRKCRGRLKRRDYPCLYYHIGRCSAPCCGKIDREEYNRKVDRIRDLLSGKTEELLFNLTAQRDEAAHNLDFERAALLRDQINTIREFSEGQQVIDRKSQARDYIGYSARETVCSFVILKMREGSLVGKEVFRTEIFSEPEEALNQFVIQYYSKIHNPPNRIYLRAPCKGPPARISETKNLAAYLSEALAKSLSIVIQPRGGDRKILCMAEENAQEDLIAWSREREDIESLVQLKRALGLSKVPTRIEGFDIAHLAGKDTVASMVCFLDGRPDKSSYRYFKMRSLKGKIDDYEAMREVIARRYMRVLNENLERPDLILVDGGKGQVSAAHSVLTSLGLTDLALIGLAKEREQIFFPHSGQPIVLEEGSVPLRIIQAVRDESHRFATSFHKRLRDGRLSRSILEDVRGIGKRRSQKLLKAFGSLEAILNSSPEELIKKAGITRDTACSLIEFLRDREDVGLSLTEAHSETEEDFS
jgi:excinuclease ABC subunit C